MNDWIEQKDDEISIDIGELLKMLLHKLWLIILGTVVGGVLLLAVAFFLIAPKYESSIKMYVNNNTESNTSITSSDITAAKNLVDTYAVVLTSKPTLNEVVEQTGVSYTYDELCDMISTESVNDTEIIRVTVTSTDPEEAAEIANAIADIAPDQIMEIVSGSSVKIVEYADAAEEKSSPSLTRYTLVGCFLGLFLICAWIILMSLRNNGQSVEDKVRRSFDVAVLSVIPDFGSKKKAKESLCDSLDFATAEAYKLLRTNISFCFTEKKKCRIIGVTSSFREEGKSTTAVNLAYTLAQAGNRVCLVDCDLHLPSIAAKLDLKNNYGMTNLLVGQSGGSSAFQKYKSEGASFYIVPAGDIPPNPSELLGSARMKSLLDSFGNLFNYVILDLPPVGIVSDALNLSGLLDGMLFVISEASYDRRAAAESLRKLSDVHAKLLGVILTHSNAQKKEYKRYGSKYGKDYGGAYGNAYGNNAAVKNNVGAQNTVNSKKRTDAQNIVNSEKTVSAQNAAQQE